MDREHYQGFELTAEHQRLKFRQGRGSTCYVWVYRHGGEDAIFAVAMTVLDRFARQEVGVLEPEGVSDLACAYGVRWAHGLIDLERWDGETAEPEAQVRAPGWQPDGSDAAHSDLDIRLHVLRSLSRMNPIVERYGYAPWLDVRGFAEVLMVRPDRIQTTLAELQTREWLEQHGTGGSVGEGWVRITRRGFDELERLEAERLGNGAPLDQVAGEVVAYLADEFFAEAYARAHDKLREALQLLSGDDPISHAGEIGYICRRAGQEFADALVERFTPPDAPDERSKTKNRIDSVIRHVRPQIGDSVHEALGRLNEYWDAVIDLHQRQSHPETRPPEDPLTIDDCRAVVFQTAFAMHELARYLRLP